MVAGGDSPYAADGRGLLKSPRLYVEADLGDGRDVALAGAQSHYLRNVMRLKPGASVRLFNGRDGEWRAEVSFLDRKAGTCVCRERTRPQDTPLDLHYLFAPLKQARLDYMAQKATEMGASVLQPVRTRHTVVSRVKCERLLANAVEAAEQCNLLTIPDVRDMVGLGEVLDGWDEGRRLIYCDEDAEIASPLAALKALDAGPLAVLIGPEGGFSTEERDRLRTHPGVTAISLGPRIMRADTAAVAALAVVQAVLGDWR
ncbi:MAG: 16S rRNA (uracil(1498)-N(3))-methyltransferase [Hyphomicrobiales bacterium]